MGTQNNATILKVFAPAVIPALLIAGLIVSSPAVQEFILDVVAALPYIFGLLLLVALLWAGEKYRAYMGFDSSPVQDDAHEPTRGYEFNPSKHYHKKDAEKRLRKLLDTLEERNGRIVKIGETRYMLDSDGAVWDVSLQGLKVNKKLTAQNQALVGNNSQKQQQPKQQSKWGPGNQPRTEDLADYY